MNTVPFPAIEVTIPHEVVVIEDELDCSLIRAWREHLRLTQAVVAERMGVSQSACAQMEAVDAAPRVATPRKITTAMGIRWEQLRGEDTGSATAAVHGRHS
jgi:transcriptional regulator with XRE-family HTH domain